ncbi:hypothetical protein BX600DRAFT_475644 [Xylariales sp. PMI_506]|nr:hypothetical protein BX600DRAFT_475644 [Xylariales sp. PMI_506]
MPSETTASLLPLIPRIFFLYLEPVIITYGLTMHYASRLPILANLTQVHLLPFPTLLAPGLGASYLLCMMLYGLAVLLSTPPNRTLLRCHIAIMIIADFVHWAVVYQTVRESYPAGRLLEAWQDPEVRSMTLGPLSTLAVKVLTLAGVFGKIRG